MFDQSFNILPLLPFPFSFTGVSVMLFLFPCYTFGAHLPYIACANKTILAKSCSQDAEYAAEEATFFTAFFREYYLD